MKERESLFNEFVNELKKAAKQREEERKQALKEKAEKEKKDFLSMLKEEKKLNEKSQWKRVKSWFQKDSRYRGVESSSQREEMFNGYIKSLTKKGVSDF